ncbi:MAG: hypothetical protein R3B84_01565 [Zavarzinella sp.]
MSELSREPAPMDVEGAELRLHAILPPGAAKHLCDLIEALYSQSNTSEITGSQELDVIPDPVIASAFEMADQDLADAEQQFAAEEAKRQQSDQPTDTEDKIYAAYAILLDIAADPNVKFKLQIEE